MTINDYYKNNGEGERIEQIKKDAIDGYRNSKEETCNL